MSPKVGELFAGIGGFGLAAQRAGFELAWACEIDDFASRVYGARFPTVPVHPDVRDFEGVPVDCITAGFPCQDLSVAGKRKGLVGERSGLFWEIVRIASRLRPRWLLLENVPGLLSSHRGRDFETVLAALDELGYGVAWRVLDAQFFGVPQRRRRVFIVGHLGAECPADVLFEPEGVPGDSSAGRAAGEAVAGSLGGGSGRRGWCDDTDRTTFVIQERAVSEGDSGPDGKGWRQGAAYTLEARHHAQAVAFGWNKSPAQSMRVGAEVDALQASPTSNPAVYVLGSHAGAADADVSNRSHANGGPVGSNISEGLAYSLRGGRKQSIVETRPRRLTPRECERLQGFPDDWTLIEGASDSARYRALGNAVAVPCVEWILRRLAVA